MAKQNFLSGGYFGKLGQTVGQRWHDKRNIRTYVIPANPRTEIQQANRNKFATAIALAQQSLIFNKGCGAFDTTSRSEFQARTSTAKTRTDSLITGDLAIPLFPDTYTPGTTISDLTATFVSSGIYNFTSATLSLATAARTIMLKLKIYNTETSAFEEVMVQTTLQTTGDHLFQIQLPTKYTIPLTSNIMGVTNDDKSFSNAMIYIPPTQITAEGDIIVNDITMTLGTNFKYYFHSPTLKALAESRKINLSVNTYNPATGLNNMDSMQENTVVGADNIFTLDTGPNNVICKNATISGVSYPEEGTTQKKIIINLTDISTTEKMEVWDELITDSVTVTRIDSTQWSVKWSFTGPIDYTFTTKNSLTSAYVQQNGEIVKLDAEGIEYNYDNNKLNMISYGEGDITPISGQTAIMRGYFYESEYVKYRSITEYEHVYTA